MRAKLFRAAFSSTNPIPRRGKSTRSFAGEIVQPCAKSGKRLLTRRWSRSGSGSDRALHHHLDRGRRPSPRTAQRASQKSSPAPFCASQLISVGARHGLRPFIHSHLGFRFGFGSLRSRFYRFLK
jgi:hypothetical protein